MSVTDGKQCCQLATFESPLANLVAFSANISNCPALNKALVQLLVIELRQQVSLIQH